MKRLLLVVLFMSGMHKSHAQFFKDNFYYEGEIGCVSSFFVKDNQGETHVFAIGGINFRGGVGVRDEDDLFFFGVYSGMDGNFRHRTGILPVYLNSRIGIPISETGRIYFSFGYGKSFQMGHEKLNGFLRKYTIALSRMNENENRQSVFVEINNHGFNFPDNNSPAITLNFGYSFTFL